MKRPVARPATVKVESRMAETDPFPFVPEMWITGRESAGKWESKEVIRSRPGLMDMVGEVERGQEWKS